MLDEVRAINYDFSKTAAENRDIFFDYRNQLSDIREVWAKGNIIKIDNFSVTEADGQLSVRLTNTEVVNAIQFDLNLPKNMMLMTIDPDYSIPGLDLRWVFCDGYTDKYRVVISSLEGIEAGNKILAKINVYAKDGYDADNGNVSISDILGSRTATPNENILTTENGGEAQNTASPLLKD